MISFLLQQVKTEIPDEDSLCVGGILASSDADKDEDIPGTTSTSLSIKYAASSLPLPKT